MREQDIRAAFSEIHAPEALVNAVLQGRKRRRGRYAAVSAACAAVASVIIFVLGGAAAKPANPTTIYMNWSMHGTLIAEDGEVLGQMEATVKGKLLDYEDQKDEISLELTLPKTFRYMGVDFTERDIGYTYPEEKLPYFIGANYCYDRESNSPSFMMFALSTDKEFMILKWDDSETIYLLLSVDPDVDQQEIWDHFKVFIETTDSVS